MTWIGGAVGAIALLLLKIWIEQEIKLRGWPGLTRKLGNIGFILMSTHALVMALIVVVCMVYHFRFGMPPSFTSYGRVDMREIVWFEGIVVPGMFSFILLYFRKNVMMLIAGMTQWAFCALEAYIFLLYSPQGKFNADYLFLNLESVVAWSLTFMLILFIVAAASATISWLYGLVDAAD